MSLKDWQRSGWLVEHQVERIVGHLMKPTDMFPPRYHVTTFPNPEQLRAIGDTL